MHEENLTKNSVKTLKFSAYLFYYELDVNWFVSVSKLVILKTWNFLVPIGTLYYYIVSTYF